MATTLNQIRSHCPCTEGWTKLLKHLGKTQGDDEPLSLLTVLTSNGIKDAIWCLRTEPTPERTQRFALAVARRVEHQSPEAKACNDVTERYLNGTATKAELDTAYTAACSVDYTTNAAANAVYTANAAACASANAAANAATCAVAYTTAAATRTVGYVATDAADAADAAARTVGYTARAAARTTEREVQAQLFKEIFA